MKLVQVSRNTVKINGEGHRLTWYNAISRLRDLEVKEFDLIDIDGNCDKCFMTLFGWSKKDDYKIISNYII